MIGPEGWDEYFPACGGDNQSPINIDSRRTQFKNMTPFSFTNFDRKYSHLVIKNTGASGKATIGSEDGRIIAPHPAKSYYVKLDTRLQAVLSTLES